MGISATKAFFVQYWYSIGGEAMSYKTNAPAFAHLQPTITEACISRKTFHPFSGEKKPQVKLRSKNYPD